MAMMAQTDGPQDRCDKTARLRESFHASASSLGRMFHASEAFPAHYDDNERLRLAPNPPLEVHVRLSPACPREPLVPMQELRAAAFAADTEIAFNANTGQSGPFPDVQNALARSVAGGVLVWDGRNDFCHTFCLFGAHGFFHSQVNFNISQELDPVPPFALARLVTLRNLIPTVAAAYAKGINFLGRIGFKGTLDLEVTLQNIGGGILFRREFGRKVIGKHCLDDKLAFSHTAGFLEFRDRPVEVLNLFLLDFFWAFDHDHANDRITECDDLIAASIGAIRKPPGE